MKWLTLLLCLFANTVFGQTWHVWDTPNFEVWSIDRSQGESLYATIEQTQDQIYRRWGLEPVRFSTRCKVWVAPNKELMNTLFHLPDGSFSKIHRDASGKIDETDIYILWDKDAVLSPLTVVCLAEYDLNFWAIRGMSILNQPIPKIRSKLLALKNQSFPIKSIFSITEAQWVAMTEDNRHLFDVQSAALCLMLRKEFGQDICLGTMKKGSSLTLTGFPTFDSIDKTFKRFVNYVVADIEQKRMPDDYLIIKNNKE